MKSLTKLIGQQANTSKSLVQSSKYFTSGFFTAEHKGKSGPKVADKIVWVNIQNNMGQFERISAFVGESLLEAFTRNQVGGVVATCDGGEDINTMLERPIDPVTYGPFCASCQVVVSNPWYSKMGELHYLEEKNLNESNTGRTECSRLACCLLVEPWMNEMIVSLPKVAGEGTTEEDY